MPRGAYPRWFLLIEGQGRLELNSMINQNLFEIFDLTLEETHIATWDLSLREWIVAHAARSRFFAGFAAREALVTAMFA
jgi:hypothetical protein